MSIFKIPGWKTGQFGGDVYHYLSTKPTSPEKKTFLFLHGFPTGVLMFRDIVPPVMEEGNGVVVVELLGYGGSSHPEEVEKYSTLAIADAVAELLAAEGVQKTVVIGHGWGSSVGNRFALKYPQHVEGLVNIGIPFIPPEAKPVDVEGLNAMFRPSLGYDIMGVMPFLASDAAPQLLSDRMESFIRITYDDSPPSVTVNNLYDTGALEASLKADRKPPFPSWASEQDMEDILNFAKGQDTRAMLGYFRFRVFHFDKKDGDLPKRLSTPYLYIDCQADPVIPPAIVKAQVDHCDNITIKSFNKGTLVIEQEPGRVLASVKEWVATMLG
ncbi:alpha/beta-hydrolase [Clavulina sp. PMI_390]|nr:alpha/beta-hydrolase [Clavulina sp. PMI_390]